MKTLPIIILILSSSYVYAGQIRICSVEEKSFIRDLIHSEKISKDNEIEHNKIAPMRIINNKVFTGPPDGFDSCKVVNPIMTDGLSYTILKNLETHEKYVSIYNGLDGASKTYGPF